MVTGVFGPFFRENTIYQTITLKILDLTSTSDATTLHRFGLLHQIILHSSIFDDLDLESLLSCKSQARYIVLPDTIHQDVNLALVGEVVGVD